MSTVTVPFPSAVEEFPVLRQSELAKFDCCPLTWRFSHEHEGREFSTHPAARGQIVHRTLAKCLEAIEDERESQVPVDVAMRVLEDVIRQAEVPLDADGLGDQVVAIPLREVAQARIDVQCWALYTSYEIEQFAGIEKRLESVLAYPDGHGGMVDRVVTGRPDLLLISDDGLDATVKDWKSTWGIPPEKLNLVRFDPTTDDPENISDEGYFQQRFYGLLAFDHFPRIQRVTLEETYLRYLSGKSKDRKGRLINPVRKATITRQELPDIRAELSALVDRFDRSYEAGKHRPSPGSHCVWCVHPRGCTIGFPGARGPGRIHSPVEAERVAGQLQVARAAAKQLGDALRPWANAHGDVRIRDAKKPRVYGPVVRSRVKKPGAEDVQRAVAAGRDPAELYESEEYVEFCVHSPEEVHPAVAEARREEEALLAMQRAAENRRRSLEP